MIDIKLLERRSENGKSEIGRSETEPKYFEEFKQGLLNRGASISSLEEIFELNKKRKELITQAETSKARQNKVSGEIAQMKRLGQIDQVVGGVVKCRRLAAFATGTQSDLQFLGESHFALGDVERLGHVGQRHHGGKKEVHPVFLGHPVAKLDAVEPKMIDRGLWVDQVLF